MKAEQIRSLRNNLKFNREEFGKLIGVVGRTVEQYELGTANPSKAVLLHLRNLEAQQKKNVTP